MNKKYSLFFMYLLKHKLYARLVFGHQVYFTGKGSAESRKCKCHANEHLAENGEVKVKILPLSAEEQ